MNEHIPKAQLKEGVFYRGHCRNAEVAQWKEGKFWYYRNKFGHSIYESIYHPGDDNGYDLFYPFEEVTE